MRSPRHTCCTRYSCLSLTASGCPISCVPQSYPSLPCLLGAVSRTHLCVHAMVAGSEVPWSPSQTPKSLSTVTEMDRSEEAPAVCQEVIAIENTKAGKAAQQVQCSLKTRGSELRFPGSKQKAKGNGSMIVFFSAGEWMQEDYPSLMSSQSSQLVSLRVTKRLFQKRSG